MKRYIIILIGNLISALGVLFFVVPNGLITGGTTGLALAANHFLNIPISTFVFIFNIIMFILGYLFLGKTFALSTLISTICYPLILSVLESTIGYTLLTTNPLLASICGGIFIGIAIGIVVKNNASTGGMDIPPLILNKKYGLPISVGMYGFDFAILLIQVFYTNIEFVLYGLFLILCYTIVLDKTLLIGKHQIQVFIVSNKHEEIRQMIISKLDRTCTLLYAKTGYKQEEYPVMLCVLSKRDLISFNELVTKIDPLAFMTIQEVKEVRGRGFSAKKEYL